MDLIQRSSALRERGDILTVAASVMFGLIDVTWLGPCGPSFGVACVWGGVVKRRLLRTIKWFLGPRNARPPEVTRASEGVLTIARDPPWSRLLEDLLGPMLTSDRNIATVSGGTARFQIVRNVPTASKQPLLRDRLNDYAGRAVEILEPRPAARIIPAISAGAIAEYRYCPHRYYLARELGLPGTPTLRSLEETGTDAGKGTLAHLALQHCDLATGKIPQPILVRAGDDREWVSKLVQNFLDSTEGQEVRRATPDCIWREARFRIPLPGANSTTAVVGVIDLAYKVNTDWKIVEFKSGKPRRETREFHVDQTRVYVTCLQHDPKLDVREAVIAYLGEPEATWTRFRPSPRELPLEEISAIAETCSRGGFTAQPARDRCGACPYGGRGGICQHRYRWADGQQE